MKATIGRVVFYAGSSSGKFRPAIVVTPYDGTDLCLLFVIEPLASPVGALYVEAKEISEEEAARGVQGWFWPPKIQENATPYIMPLSEDRAFNEVDSTPEKSQAVEFVEPIPAHVDPAF